MDKIQIRQSLKEKKPSIQEQIKFIQEGRRIIEDIPDGQICFDANNAAMFKAIEENLNAIKLMCGDIS